MEHPSTSCHPVEDPVTSPKSSSSHDTKKGDEELNERCDKQCVGITQEELEKAMDDLLRRMVFEGLARLLKEVDDCELVERELREIEQDGWGDTESDSESEIESENGEGQDQEATDG